MDVAIPLAVVAGEYMESATVVRWLKQPGEAVDAGEAVALVETAKATMEVLAPAAGILARVAFPVGSEVPVGEVLGWIETMEAPREAPHRSGAAASARLAITPAARRLAAQLGVDPASLRPRRPDGRITEADVRAAAGGGSSGTETAGDPARGPEPAPPYSIAVPTAYRRITARRMAASAAIPQFQLTVAAPLEPLIRRRAALPDLRRPGLTAYFVRAAADALTAHPQLNATYEHDEIRRHRAIGIGVAVATEDGLVVPVIRDAAGLSPEQIHDALEDLRRRASARGLRPEDVQGGTFTISNLGPAGVLQFAALVNPPQVAILAVGAVHPDPAGRAQCLLTLSCDHRVLDGADGAAFLRTLCTRLRHGESA